ncbi:MAG: hypothetical protein QW112_01480 [Candidatus Micrarchaeia archaeon]
MARYKIKKPKKITKSSPTKKISTVERGLKTRILALLMLILASSLGLWFAEFQPMAILLWLLIVFAGGYAVFEFELFISKVLVIVSAFVMEFLALDGVRNLFVLGSPGNVMMIIFGILDVILIYALMKL